MTHSTIRARLMASSMITGVTLAALSAGGAFAQAAAAAAAAPAASASDDGATNVTEFVVTGSRIPQPNLSSVSPIHAVTAQDFKLTGANDTIDALNQLPQVSVGGGLNNTPNPLSGSGGFTTIDLRNLGTVRTLVLEDGKRLMPGDPTLGGEAPDLDTIPHALISRVDLVTGGASAVYGSDALAGVVNFVMKHNFEGAELDVQYGGNWHNNDDNFLRNLAAADVNDIGPQNAPTGSTFDGQTVDVTATIGANSPDGKGNVTAYVTYRHQDPIKQSARDYSFCQFVDGVYNGGAPRCTGSSNSNFFNDQNSGLTYAVLGAEGSNMFIPRGSQPTTPPIHFNANPYEYLSRGDERYLGGFFAHYQAAPWADVYSDFTFMDDRTVIHAGPSALFQQIFNVNCSNPFLSAQQVQTICTDNGLGGTGQPQDASLSIGRRDVEGGPRIYSFEHLSYKADIGLRGDLGEAWHYDVYGQYGRTQYNSMVQNDISLMKAQDALLVGGTLANPVCLSGNPGCVPYNIFADGGVTQGALNYILTSGTATGDTQEQIVSGNLTGDLGKYGVKSPFATDGVGVNFGSEYRREQLDLIPDETSLSGDLAGAGGASPPVHGSFDVKELFAEVRAPLVQDMPGIKELSFEGGYRFSHYSLAGNTNTYKLAFNYSPVSDIRFRGSFQRAVRAPNVNELFTPQLITNTSVVSSDPCSAADSGGSAKATLAQCMNTGVTAAQYGDGRDPAIGGTDKIAQCPAGQCGTVLGGNPNLTPETSKTYSVGVVIRPREYIPGFDFSVDYFNIDVENAISTFPINIAFNDCLTQGTHCDLVVRQANGSLFGTNILQGGYISGTDLNIGFLKTEGFDFAINYRVDLDKFGLRDKGSLSLGYNSTFTESLINEPIPGQGSYDCAGLFGFTCGQPTPTYRHQLRVTYESPWNFTLSVQWRYLSRVAFDGNQSNPLFGGPIGDTFDDHIPAYNYFDLSGTYKVRPGVVVRAGINNIFDRDPPLLDSNVVGSGNPNTYSTYDLLGRAVFVGLTADF
ncbi:MAG: TonB-dependent receptor domain-containing protein [Caulobacteraceae bacterium]